MICWVYGNSPLSEILDGEDQWGSVIHIARTSGLVLHSDITSQKLFVYWDGNPVAPGG
ncbi:MAG: hypothetical protein FWG72_00895 [Oscillospiraceae bacterium]|nr:hypothetical protein [Oscillospiraceae bacterium]